MQTMSYYANSFAIVCNAGTNWKNRILRELKPDWYLGEIKKINVAPIYKKWELWFGLDFSIQTFDLNKSFVNCRPFTWAIKIEYLKIKVEEWDARSDIVHAG